MKSSPQRHGDRTENHGVTVCDGFLCEPLCDLRVSVVKERSASEALAPVHDAQLLTYLRLGGWRVGLLINFNVAALKSGIHRKILGYELAQAAAPGKA